MKGPHSRSRTNPTNLTRPRWWLLWFFVAAAVAIAVAALITITRAPLPVHEGTAPSVVTDTVGAEAEPLRQPGTVDPRETTQSSTGGRAARGSGIEGVTSGGTTHAPPGGG
jgi:heme A synthase